MRWGRPHKKILVLLVERVPSECMSPSGSSSGVLVFIPLIVGPPGRIDDERDRLGVHPRKG